MHSVENTVGTCGLLFVIIFGANLFSSFMVQTHLPNALADGAEAFNLSGPMVMVMIIIAYIFFGCFLEAIGMMLITVPVFLPLVTHFGYDPVWFGVIIVIVAEVGLIHPPMGLNLFVIQAHAPDIRIGKIYRGIVPFLFAPLALIILMFFFPQIALLAAEAVLRVGASPSAPLTIVMAGLVPAISLRKARQCIPKRDRRDEPGDDGRSCAALSGAYRNDELTSSFLPAGRGPRGWRPRGPSATPSAPADCRGARAAARNSRALRPASGRARRTAR